MNPDKQASLRVDIARDCDGYTVRAGVIVSPGKFEGEPEWLPYLWHATLEGSADVDGYDGDTAVSAFQLDDDDSIVMGLGPTEGTYGVESLRRRDDSLTGQPSHEYLNTGDPYAATLVYHRDADAIRVGSWGNIVESAPEGTYE